MTTGNHRCVILQRQGERFADAPRPDLILLDLNLSDMPAPTATAIMRSNYNFDSGLRTFHVGYSSIFFIDLQPNQGQTEWE